MDGDRTILHKGEKVLLRKLAKKYKGKYELRFEAKDGKKLDCKISIVPVSLPDYPDKKLNLAVCNGLGKEPLMLLTSLDSQDKRLCVTITKVYLMRWHFRFKKQEYGLENFRIRSLKSIRNLDTLLSISIGYIGVLSEKIDESIEVREIVAASKRLYGLPKFTSYAIADGLFVIFSKHYTGISAFFPKPQRSIVSS